MEIKRSSWKCKMIERYCGVSSNKYMFYTQIIMCGLLDILTAIMIVVCGLFSICSFIVGPCMLFMNFESGSLLYALGITGLSIWTVYVIAFVLWIVYYLIKRSSISKDRSIELID